MKWPSLHNHFVYSKLDSMLQVKDAVKRAKEYGMEALAITDHGVVIGIPYFFQVCKEEGIKPILGVEIYLTENHLIKSKEEMRRLGNEVYHLILYAKNDEGLSNLYQICSEAGNNGLFDGYERIDLPFIVKNNLGKGIIATSACLGGPVASWLQDQKHRSANREKAVLWAQMLKDTFEHFYIELGCNSIPEQHRVNNELISIANELDIPFIISGDTHYLDKEDAKIHEILLCMNTNSTLSDPNRFRFPTDDFYLLHPDEVEAFCKKHNIPDIAIQNTIEIANMCTADPTPKTKKGLLPQFDTPKEYTSEGYLHKKAYDGLLQKAMKKKLDYVKYSERLAYELDIINMQGYSDYFLILWDLIEFCKREGIMTGPGRGSAAGALTSYVLGITKLDPVEHELYFERFLNPEKSAFPDIDTDFEYLRRQEVIEYILKKYGKENVAQIITQNTLKLKSGTRRIMKVLGYSLKEQDEVAKAIPDKFPDQSEVEYSKMVDIRDDPDKYRQEFGDDKFRSIESKVKQFWEYMKKYPDVNIALGKLEGCIAAYGVHPSGVVITNPGALKLHLPTRYFDSAPLPVCQFDMESLDFCKALKLDVLGLKTLSIIDLACKLAGISKDVLDTEDFNSEPEIYEMLREGLTKQVFQLSSPGITKMVQDMNLSSFEELTDALALYRPGPLGAKDESTGLTMVETYIQNKNSGTITSIHKDLDAILKPTKGCLVYQEQLMRTAQIIAGYSLGRADNQIRKPVGKKKIKLFPEIRKEFVYGSNEMECPSCGKKDVFNMPDTTGNLNCPNCGVPMKFIREIVPGAVKMKYPENFGHSLFDMILKFGGYGFNKSHSACYAVIAWMTAWLKYHYPAEFMAAVMTVHCNNQDEIIESIVECKKLGIDILPPDINKSKEGFTVEVLPDGGKAIRYGLMAIKGIGEAPASEIVAHQPYASFDDYMNKVHDPSIVRIKADGTKMTNPLNKRNEPTLILAGCFDELEPNRHKLINQYYAIRKDKDVQQMDEKAFDRKLKLEYEKEYMGMYISDHPLKNYPFTRWAEVDDGDLIQLGGIIRKLEPKTSRFGGEFCTGTIETLEDKRRFIMYDKVYTAYKDRLKVGARVVIEGVKNEEYSNINVKRILFAIPRKKLMKPTEPEEDFSVTEEDLEAKEYARL